jgi:L-serine deaminase
MAVVSDELGLAVDPVSGMVFQVPNVELAKRMRTYFTGC